MAFAIGVGVKNFSENCSHPISFLNGEKIVRNFRAMVLFDVGAAISLLVLGTLVCTSVIPLPPAAMYAFFGIGGGIVAIDSFVIGSMACCNCAL